MLERTIGLPDKIFLSILNNWVKDSFKHFPLYLQAMLIKKLEDIYKRRCAPQKENNTSSSLHKTPILYWQLMLLSFIKHPWIVASISKEILNGLEINDKISINFEDVAIQKFFCFIRTFINQATDYDPTPIKFFDTTKKENSLILPPLPIKNEKSAQKNKRVGLELATVLKSEPVILKLIELIKNNSIEQINQIFSNNQVILNYLTYNNPPLVNPNNSQSFNSQNEYYPPQNPYPYIGHNWPLYLTSLPQNNYSPVPSRFTTNNFGPIKPYCPYHNPLFHLTPPENYYFTSNIPDNKDGNQGNNYIENNYEMGISKELKGDIENNHETEINKELKESIENNHEMGIDKELMEKENPLKRKRSIDDEESGEDLNPSKKKNISEEKKPNESTNSPPERESSDEDSDDSKDDSENSSSDEIKELIIGKKQPGSNYNNNITIFENSSNNQDNKNLSKKDTKTTKFDL